MAEKASLGRIVHYVLNAGDAETINGRRAKRGSKAAAHRGKAVESGEHVAGMVVGVNAAGEVDLKCPLNGTDEFWTTGRARDDGGGLGTWHWPERVR